MPNIKFLYFDSEHTESITKTQKRETIRVGTKPADDGDFIVLKDDDDNLIGVAVVIHVEQTTVTEYASRNPKWHETYDDVEECMDVLRTYYSRREITPETKVWVVKWDKFTTV